MKMTIERAIRIANALKERAGVHDWHPCFGVGGAERVAVTSGTIEYRPLPGVTIAVRRPSEAVAS